MNKYFSKFLYVLGESKIKLLLLMFLFIITSLLEAFGISLVGPFLWLASKPESLHEIPLLNWIYTTLSISSSKQFILLSGLLLVIIFCVKSFLYFSARSFIYQFSFTQQAKLISRLLKTYLSVPYIFYLNRDIASLIKNITLETQSFCYKCLLPILEGTSNFITTIFLVLLLAKANLFFLLIIAVIILPTFLLFYKLKNQAAKLGKEGSESYHQIIRTIDHALGGVKETYVIGCESYFEEQINVQANRYATSASKYNSLQILPRLTFETLLIVFLVLFVSVYQILFSQTFENLISVLSVFAVAAIRLIPTVSQSLNAIGDIQHGSYTLDLLYADLKSIQKHNKEQYSNTRYSPAFKGLSYSEQIKYNVIHLSSEIYLQNITYYYPNSTKPSLNQIYLRINKGQSIALIGKSGAGKTTLADIILGLLDPTEGDIIVDGVSIYKDLRSWQNMIGYIPQSIFIIDDTIERNVAFGVPDYLIDTEKLNRAIYAAQLTELVQQLPDGIKTSVGERGVRLSGGQRQRIGIARALYHEREILVLDEATAALDNETESMVTEAIRSLSGMKTIIIIAHRLTTIRHCDHIYLMEKGRIVKSGNYEEVIREEPYVL